MNKLTLTGALVAAGVLAIPTHADSIELTGVLRDFKQSHPDMQYSQKSFGVRTGLVTSQLGEDGKPVLNTSVDYNG